MATQQEVIKKFMAALDTHTLTKRSNETDAALATRIIDTAIRASSNFKSTQEVIDKIVEDCESYLAADSKNGYKKFLLEKCGINLDNDDTGAITGSDAGGSTTKTAESIVSESGSLKTNFEENFFKVGELTVKLATGGGKNADPKEITFNDLNNENERFIWQSLRSYWIESGLNLIAESYGNNFTFSEGNSSVKTLYVIFDYNMDYSTRAKTLSGPIKNQKCTIPLELHINMNRFSNLSGINGGNSDGSAWYLDRTIAHELTHAVMIANVDYFFYLPQFIAEGMADLTNGIDDKRKSYITDLAKNPDLLKEWLDVNDTSSTSNYVYSAGYMFLRYLAKQTSLQGINISNTKTKAKVTGTDNADTIENYGANSTITALGGNDFIGSYVAKSSINAGGGNDTIDNTSYGTNTTLFGGAGNDSILNSANAKIDAGTGADTITNTNLGGKATLFGGTGNDYITTYNADNVSISGGTDNDKIELRGTGKNITVSGGGGNDTISISGGTALIQYSAGDGNDSVVGFNVNSTLQIGGGTGTYSTTKSGSNVVVTAGTGKVTLTGAANLSKLNIAGKKVSPDGGKNITNTKSKTLVTGSAYADTLYNNATKVTIDALGGNDSISNRNSGASINGGAGKDTIYNDSIYGDGSRVTIIGGSGKDSISNYAGNVIIYGNADSDEIYNGTGGNSVTIDGGDSSDEIDSRGTNVSIKGGAGNDSIYIDGSKATVNGGTGKDSIRNFGENTLFQYKTGDGNDSIWGFKTNSTLQIDGGSVVSLQTSGSNVIATVDKGKVTLVSAANLNVVNIQGSGSSDYIKSTVSGAKIDALGGNDTISNTGSKSKLYGGKGNDKFYNYATAVVTISGGSGADTINNWGGATSMVGGSGNDVIWGNDKADTLRGGADNDKLHGDAGNDKIYGDSGNDSLWGEAGNDSLWGGKGNDTFIYTANEGIDTIFDYEKGDMLKILNTDGSQGKFKSSKYSGGDLTLTITGGGKVIFDDVSASTQFNINGTTYKISGSKLKKQ